MKYYQDNRDHALSLGFIFLDVAIAFIVIAVVGVV